MSSESRSITNFLSCQTNKPVNDKLSADLKVALAHWIASSGRPTLIVEDDGLRTALQNQAYILSSRRTIDTVIGEMYKEKLAEHKKVVESIHSIALTTDFWTSNDNESYCGVTGPWFGWDERYGRS